MRRPPDAPRATALLPRAAAAAAAMAALLLLLRRFSTGSASPVIGAFCGAAVLLLTMLSLRWNREALTALRRRGPRYDPKRVLRKERERLLKRKPDAAPPEERT